MREKNVVDIPLNYCSLFLLFIPVVYSCCLFLLCHRINNELQKQTIITAIKRNKNGKGRQKKKKEEKKPSYPRLCGKEDAKTIMMI